VMTMYWCNINRYIITKNCR